MATSSACTIGSIPNRTLAGLRMVAPSHLRYVDHERSILTIERPRGVLIPARLERELPRLIAKSKTLQSVNALRLCGDNLAARRAERRCSRRFRDRWVTLFWLRHWSRPRHQCRPRCTACAERGHHRKLDLGPIIGRLHGDAIRHCLALSLVMTVQPLGQGYTSTSRAAR